MSKKKHEYMCRSCGSDFSKWHGRCPDCGEWNAIIETSFGPAPGAGPSSGTMLLSSVTSGEIERILSPIHEFNLVCGGGIVPGSVILIGGEPGIGKSTLALQIASGFHTLYVSGEESPSQLRQRADRLKVNSDAIIISTANDVEVIIAQAMEQKPACLIVDSVQTMYSSQVPGLKGSVSQVRESTSKLVDFAKRSGVPVVLIGHITKDGAIAGPKILEHLVDTVLYFEGDFSRDFRMLRAFKNRFGSVNEIGLFQMTPGGLAEVKDKNKIFLNPFLSKAPGNAVSAAVEGSRIILFEVQALVTFTSFSNPRRMSDGFDFNRLVLIVAVLEKHAGLKLNSFDVFINVSGGFRINETAADLAVATAIASSLKEKPVSDRIGFIGEISLSGEIRPVSQCARRVIEYKNSGFSTILLPESDSGQATAVGFEGEIIGVKTIQDAMAYLF